MTNEHKILLGHFIARMGMFITQIDEPNIISFITGYEIGTNNKCDFTTLLSEYMNKKFKIKKSNQEWEGQIRQYGYKKNMDWVEAFKQVGLEVLIIPKG